MKFSAEHLIRLFILQFMDYYYTLNEAANEYFEIVCGSDDTEIISNFGIEAEQFLAVACFLSGTDIKTSDAFLIKLKNLLENFEYSRSFNHAKFLEHYDWLHKKYEEFVKELITTNTPYKGDKPFFTHTPQIINIDCEGGFMQLSPLPDQKSEKEVAEFAYEKIVQTLTEANNMQREIKELENFLKFLNGDRVEIHLEAYKDCVYQKFHLNSSFPEDTKEFLNTLKAVVKVQILDAKYQLYKLTSQL